MCTGWQRETHANGRLMEQAVWQWTGKQNDEWRAWLQIRVRQVSKKITHTMHATGRLTKQAVWQWTGKQNARIEMQQVGVMENSQALIPLIGNNSRFNSIHG